MADDTYLARWQLQPNKEGKLKMVVEWTPAEQNFTTMLYKKVKNRTIAKNSSNEA